MDGGVFGGIGIGIRRFLLTSIPTAYLGKQNKGFSFMFIISQVEHITIKRDIISQSLMHDLGLCLLHAPFFSFTAVGKQWHWKLCKTYSYVERYIRSSIQRYHVLMVLYVSCLKFEPSRHNRHLSCRKNLHIIPHLPSPRLLASPRLSSLKRCSMQGASCCDDISGSLLATPYLVYPPELVKKGLTRAS